MNRMELFNKFILGFLSIKALGYTITGLIFLVQFYDNFCGYMIINPVLIIINTFLLILSYSLENFNQRFITLKKIIAIISTIIFLYLVTYIFIFLDHQKCTELTPIRDFVIFYLIIDYVLPTVLIILLYFTVWLGIRICCPHYLIRIMNNSPIRTGASDSELEQLNSIKFDQSIIAETDSNHNICSICIDEYHDTDNIIILPCKHHYHEQCCKEWLKINKSCPICRRTNIFDLV